MNEPRNRIFNSSNSRHVCSVVVAAFGIQTVTVPFAFADVAMPPPAQHQNASFPSEQALRNMGYNPDTGVWRVNAQNAGRAEVKKDGGTITGSQPKTVTATGVHGEKAQIATVQRQDVSVSKLQTASNGIAVGLGFANGMNSAAPHVEKLGSAIAKGDYKDAAWQGFSSVFKFVDGFFSSPGQSTADLVDRFGKGYLDGKHQVHAEKTDKDANVVAAKKAAAQAKAAQAQAERAGDFRAAVANAAAAKAATAAATAEQQAQQSTPKAQPGKYQIIAKWYETAVKVDKKTGRETLVTNTTWTNVYADTPIGADNGYWRTYQFDKAGYPQFTFYWTSSAIKPDTPVSKIGLKFSDWGTYKNQELEVFTYQGEYIEGVAPNVNKPNVNPEDFMLNQQEVAGILKRMLEDQNTNHAELMKQLAKLGGVIDQATTANSFAPATALSAPFTPEGSNVPQQTLFKLDDKGNVTATAIPRPDLKPNSSQAPARQPIVPSQTQGQNNVQPAPNTQTGEQTAPSGQQNRPETEAGGNPPENYDYEDFIIPERTVNLGTLRPVNVFATDGVCPSGVSVQMGVLGTIDFNYDEACRILRLLRPIIILATMITCSMMAYAAVKEL